VLDQSRLEILASEVDRHEAHRSGHLHVGSDAREAPMAATNLTDRTRL